jgi:hypothetical protein
MAEDGLEESHLVMCNRVMRMVHKASDLFMEEGTDRIVCQACRDPGSTYSRVHATRHMGPEIERVVIRASAHDGTPWILCVAKNTGTIADVRPKPNIPALHAQLVRELILARGPDTSDMMSVLQQFATLTDQPVPDSLIADYNLETMPASDSVISSVAWKMLAHTMQVYFDALQVAPDGNLTPYDVLGQNYTATSMTTSAVVNVHGLFVRTCNDLAPALYWHQCIAEEHLVMFDPDKRLASLRMSKNSTPDMPKVFSSNELRRIDPDRVAMCDLTPYPISKTQPLQRTAPTSMSRLEYCYLSSEADPHKSVLCLNSTGAVCISHGDRHLIAYAVIVWYGPCGVGPYWHLLCNTQSSTVMSLHGKPHALDIVLVQVQRVYEVDICFEFKERMLHSDINCVWRPIGYQRAFCQCATCGRDGLADSGLLEESDAMDMSL